MSSRKRRKKAVPDRKIPKVRRGEVWYVSAVDAIGSEQQGDRPAVILQSDELNECSPTTVVAFITTQLDKKSIDAHVHIPSHSGLPRKSMVLTEKAREIDKSRLRQKIGKLTRQSMARVDRALKYTLGLRRRKHKNEKT